MCEYCGCQEIAVIDELTREHDAVVALIAQVREQLAAGRVDEAATTCRSMSMLLEPHTVVEEEGLFPELAEEFPDHVATLRSEHRVVEAALGDAAQGTPPTPRGRPASVTRCSCCASTSSRSRTACSRPP